MELDSQPFDSLLKEKAQLVLDNLEQGNVSIAVQELLHINDAKTDSLYRQIGKITRGLHNAIGNLELSNGDSGGSDRDVQARVGYVINLTQDAANRTMDLAEEATPIAAELGTASKALREDWRKLANRELSADEFRELYKKMDDFLVFSEEKSNQLHVNLTDIVVTQGYQDLSGQVLQKIVDMLNATEGDLVNLLAMAANLQDVSCIAEAEAELEPLVTGVQKDILAEGPLPDSAASLKSQSEVDDLLSNLGF
ncbi:MAG: chemotaxis protein CheZ [Candidatus Azotimanducaceae bacterium]|jgi:chemotaxis protein CheZ